MCHNFLSSKVRLRDVNYSLQRIENLGTKKTVQKNNNNTFRWRAV